MKRKIVLHGKLRFLFGGELVVEASTVAEAIKALCALTGRSFYPKPGQPRHEIKVVGFDTEQSLFARLKDTVTELHLIPAFTGSGGLGSGLTKIIIGVVLIALAFWTGGASLSAMPWYSSIMFSMGVSLVLGGALEIISPAPKMDMNGFQNASDPEASKYLGSGQNTVKIGTRIPLLYGEHMHYGHYVSFNINAVQVAV